MRHISYVHNYTSYVILIQRSYKSFINTYHASTYFHHFQVYDLLILGMGQQEKKTSVVRQHW